MTVSCSHDGFSRLGSDVIHRRTWELGSKRLSVKDTVTGGDRNAVARFHFHPEVELLMDAQGRGRAILPGGQVVALQFSGGEASLLESTYHPQFGISVTNGCLQISMTSDQCETIFSW